MKKVTIHQIDAFTDEIFGGNPAAVVADAAELTEEEMQNIAREMNLSETAFVLPAQDKSADIRVRYFTPTTEVKFCGHATVATLRVLASGKSFGLGAPGKNDVRIETAAGLYDMSVANTDSGSRMSFSVPSPTLQEYGLQGKDFTDAFGINAVVDSNSKIFVEEKPQKFVFVPVVSLSALSKIRYDKERVKAKFVNTNTIIFCFYSKETFSGDSDLHSRCFGPLIGLEEDPFTGAIQAGLFLSAQRNGYVAEDQKSIKTEQGHVMGRPGFAEATKIDDVISVTASAVKVFSAEVEL